MLFLKQGQFASAVKYIIGWRKFSLHFQYLEITFIQNQQKYIKFSCRTGDINGLILIQMLMIIIVIKFETDNL